MIWKPICVVAKDFNELLSPQFKASYVRAKKTFSSMNVRHMPPSDPSLRGNHGGNMHGTAQPGDIGWLNVHRHLFGSAMANLGELTIFFGYCEIQQTPRLPREILSDSSGWFMMSIPKGKWHEFKDSFEIQQQPNSIG